MERIKRQVSPAQIILLGFAGTILLGALALMLPFATRDGHGASFLDALFTATSATCVTGLVVQDTWLYWTAFGQAVILALIQIGGMGVITVMVAVQIFSGRKIGLKQRWVMQESISGPQLSGILRHTRFILRAVLCIEGIGAALLAIRFCPRYGLGKGLWFSVFHAVSAFCNAGFDLMGEQGPFSSLTGYVGDGLVVFTITGLIVVGGLGFYTWGDIRTHGLRLRAYSLQSKLILTMTAILLGGGFLFFYCFEFSGSQWAELSGTERVLAAWFQAVTPRTAGFNTVDLGMLSQPGVAVTILLMLIGGAPGSTAGGFKVTTLAVLTLGIGAIFRRREHPRCYGRRIPTDTERSAAAIFLLYIFLFLGGGMVLCLAGGADMQAALLEASSAVGTVGLSLGLTPGLSDVCHCVLIFLMYLGRVGGLTMIYAVTAGAKPEVAQLPQERVTVG